MKKIWVVGAAFALILALAAVAIAQVAPQQNEYEVDGSTSPNRAGSKKKPLPIGINFDFSVSEAQGRRPAVIKKYSIRFAGTQVNTNFFPKCSDNTIANKGPEGCPARSIVGTGFIENETGDRNDPNSKTINCNAGLFVINQGDQDAVIFVRGTQTSTNPRTRCDINIAAPIEAQFVRRGATTALEFQVPDSLTHPLPTLSNAVKRVDSTIRRLTTRRRGKTRGFFEAVGGCRNRKRAITVIFTPESGTQAQEQHLAVCRR